MAVHSNDVCLKMFSVYQVHSLITSFMTPYYIHTHAHTHTHTHTHIHTHTGQPIDLAYMDDAELAFLLSWVSDYYMDVVVTHDSDTAQALLGRKLKCLALDQVSTFTIQGR